ncbi:hypothetical protein K1719_009535 [Acacia pycnantha]|nr:hypothetical protein K1719_009535 [Acacia pycnantha]
MRKALKVWVLCSPWIHHSGPSVSSFYCLHPLLGLDVDESVEEKENVGGHEGDESVEEEVVEGGVEDERERGPSKLSYRDKLLSPSCAGFLVNHSKEDDIVQGWKDYFHKMNENDARCDPDESVEEETQEERRLEGKPGVMKFTAEEYTAWCLPWMNSLIIKVLGASFQTYIIRDRINRMWRPKDPLKLVPLNNGYYIVSFSNKEDKEFGLSGRAFDDRGSLPNCSKMASQF